VAEQKEVVNIRQLAQTLGRDYKNVHTDVSALEKLGLIEKDEKGVLTVPYDEIVIHAGLTEAA
jgi:predicted transcriptional regulator